MIDTHIYDYDTYSRDTEMSTYLCAELVMSDIDAYLRDRSNLALDSDMVFPRLLERNLHLAAENKVLSTVLDSYNWIDIDTKSIRGANVEAVRDIVGPQVFDDFFSDRCNSSKAYHEAKQVAEDLSYDVGAPKHFDDCIQYFKEQTEEFVLSDKARERIGGKQFDVPQKKRLDLSQFYGENKYSDGTDIELGD